MFSSVVSGLMGAVGVDGVAAGTAVLTVHCLAVLVRGKMFILVRVEGSYSQCGISRVRAPCGVNPVAGLVTRSSPGIASVEIVGLVSDEGAVLELTDQFQLDFGGEGQSGTAGMCSPYIHSATRPSPGVVTAEVTVD